MCHYSVVACWLLWQARSVLPILTDGDVRARLDPASAVAWMAEAIDAHHRGELLAPPRVTADLGEGKLLFTTGRWAGRWYGYRSYDSLPAEPGSQVVVVHDDRTGAVRAAAIGTELGRRRTGAIGGVAVGAMAPRAASVMAVVGTGAQAYTQVWAIGAVLPELAELRVHSRDAGHRAAFAEAVRPLTGAVIRDAGNVHSAVEGADVVVLATSSSTPILDTAWLAPACLVSTLGPKQRGRAEFGPDLADAAALLVTDSPAQIAAYDPPNVLAGTSAERRLVSLGALRAGAAGRPAEGISVFFSVGLAGTEVHLLSRLAGVPV